ncbi:hypothetical protein EUGRSUZ_H03332 [Eucalyptus grandis]|uniref:Uncharacterized protein n=2 Tax=Eucalyptus grandis TaxID=71139 RepID=A0A059B4M0_EUCGR|nr:hypothetical protein EUGRSUZ_H03332 [Eucalyptus grandis]
MNDSHRLFHRTKEQRGHFDPSLKTAFASHSRFSFGTSLSGSQSPKGINPLSSRSQTFEAESHFGARVALLEIGHGGSGSCVLARGKGKVLS